MNSLFQRFIRLIPLFSVLIGLVILLIPASGYSQDLPTLPEKYLDKSSSKLTLLDFYSPHCGYCQKMEKPYDKIQMRHKDKVRFVRVDLSMKHNNKIRKAFHNPGTPTYILFTPQGKPLARVIGADEKQLEKTLKKYAY